MKQLLIILICLFAVNANALTKEQIEEKFNLPPEPDVELNNSTLLGVDIEGSKKFIRDDIERKIGIVFFEKSKARGIYNRQAELWTLILKNPESPEILEYIDEYRKNIACQIRGFVDDFNGDSLSYLHGSTPERYLSISEVIHNSGYQYYRIDDDTVKAYCESFK